jgi:hypothetical protein
MDFDPNKYLSQEDEGSGFDPKAYLGDTGPSELDSAGRGLAQGASFGLRDEGAGFLKSPSGALKEIANKFGAHFSDDDIEAYKQERDASRGLDLAAKQANPKSFLAGELGGGVATSLVPGLGIAEGAGLAKTLGTTAAQGAAYGLGGSEREELGDIALDTLKGGGAGLAAGAAGIAAAKGIESAAPVIGNFIKRSAAPLDDAAENLAVKATGATGRQSAQFADDAGRELLDRGLVKFGDTPGKIAERVGAANEEAGRAIGSSLESLEGRGVSVDLGNIKKGIENKIAELSEVPGNEKIIRQLESELENLVGRGQSNLPISKAELAKRNYQAQTNYASPEAEKKSTAQIANLFKKEVEETALRADPSLAGKFTEGKKTYGLLSPIQEAAEKRAATQAQSPFGGLGDFAAAAAGVPGGIGGSALGVAAKRMLAPRLASSGAVTADFLANIAKQSPEALGKFSNIFQSALQRGPQAVAATHFVLEQSNPEYRQKIKELNEENEMNDLARNPGGQ